MSYVCVAAAGEAIEKQVFSKKKKRCHMNFPEKQILINNFKNVEEYLKSGIYADEQLSALRLEENLHVPGVSELLNSIPDGYDPEKMKKFYEETGLRLQVEYYNKEYEVIMYDKDGRYPREDAAIWNKDFVNNLKDHPEWLEPQEEPDILIRYIPAAKKENEGDGERINIHCQIHIY